MKGEQLVSICGQAAQEYLAAGWSALPLCPPDHVGVGRKHGKRCQSPGKVPLGEWKQWQSQRMPSWRLELAYRNHPNANVGIILGEVSGLIGIDVDGHGGAKLLLSLSRNYVPKTLVFRTGNGFRLLYGLAGGEVPPANRKFADERGRVEILGNGMCSVLPPSRHANGKSYEWVLGHSPRDRQAALLPEWVYQITQRRSSTPTQIQGPITTFRNVRLFKAACSLRRQGLDHAGILQCLEILNQRCEPPLEIQEVQKIARNATRYEPQSYEAEIIG